MISIFLLNPSATQTLHSISLRPRCHNISKQLYYASGIYEREGTFCCFGKREQYSTLARNEHFPEESILDELLKLKHRAEAVLSKHLQNHLSQRNFQKKRTQITIKSRKSHTLYPQTTDHG